MGRAAKKTPERVVIEVAGAVAKLGQNGFAKDVGLPLRSVQKYLKGEAEPTQATLEKLAKYFNKPVWWFREDHREWQIETSKNDVKILKDLLELFGIAPEHLKGTVVVLAELMVGEVSEVLSGGCPELDKKIIEEAQRLTDEAMLLIRQQAVKEMIASRHGSKPNGLID